jgi:hypothetical protein
MTSTERTRITLGSPNDMLASIPALLGFRPVNSLVVFGLRGPKSTELAVALRADLPPPSRAGELARCLLLPLLQQRASAATLVVVGGADGDDLPYRELMARCESTFVGNGLLVVHQLWTPDTDPGRRWRCYDEPDCTGVVSDPTGTELAAAVAEAGLTVFDRREDIVAMLTPAPPEVLARRSAALERSSTETEPGAPPAAKLDFVRSAIEAAGRGVATLTDKDVVTLADALTDHRIRDVCLDFDELPDVAAAERLWTALARATPAPERAEAACLLAFSAYARGDGVLAGIALDQAEAADPGHRLSGLLRSALTLGLPPTTLRTAGIRAATFARQSLTEEPDP